jgi:rubrerythrin
VARGWESKSVQEQIEAARSRHGESKQQLTPEQAALAKKRDALLLHRTRVLHDLETCHEERYRKTLTEGLAYLEAELTALGWTVS